MFDESGFIWNEITVNEQAEIVKASKMTDLEYKIFDNTYIATQCAAYCKKDMDCESFAFSEDEHACHMYKTALTQAEKTSIKTAPHFDLYPKDAFIAPDELWGPCARYPCKNGGVCIDDVSNGLDYKCVCPSSHWTGKNCDTQALNPEWDKWSDWSVCSVSCGVGWKSRSRVCKDKLTDATLTQLQCYGYPIEIALCQEGPCPVWDEWSTWGDCSSNTTCGPGTRTRTRQCLHVGPNGAQPSDQGCLAGSKESGPCQVTTCSNVPIQLVGGKVYGEGRVLIYNDVDKRWGQVCNKNWDMNDASVVCRQLGLNDSFKDGTSLRTRKCDYPSATNGGTPCPGIDTESKPCFIKPCPVDGVWLVWSTWGQCSLSCGNGSQTRTRQCQTPQHDGKWCDGSSNETQLCNTHYCPIDGIWNAWTAWGACDRDCDGGKQQRSRSCNGPFYGGNNCTGDETMVQDCNTHNCPVKGNWRQWTPWTPCNKTCGTGRQSRVRECNYGQFGGENCTGNSRDERDCNTHHCPVDGYFHEWQTWSACSVSCANGTQTRNRTCEPPRYNGTECSGVKQEQQPCKLRECPVNGEWEPWSSWDPCSHTCGNGTKTRTRKCYGQAHGGEACPGSNTDTAFCYIRSCAIDGVWLNWGDWSQCSATCGNRTRYRTRQCDGPYFGGNACPGNDTDTEECELVNCPIDGVWNEWGSWDQCSVSCGNGTQARSRQCNGPFYGGAQCPGDETDQQSCNTHPCPVDGEWEQWKSWSQCSEQCAGGSQTRLRVCHGKANGGDDCVGNATEHRVCNLHPCPVDGIFESWSLWQSCTVTCGGGTRTRNRTCIGPFYNGNNCTGSTIDEQLCNTDGCPVNGTWNAWSNWETCDKTCGGGHRLRRRTCNQPLFGGNPCSGDTVHSENCNDNPCPVNGAWSEWSRWMDCNSSCGGGTSRRYRICTPAKHGGKSCEGPEEEFEPCNNFSCPVDGKWLEWSLWSSCSESCGKNATRHRDRHCEGPYHGGRSCEGESTDIEECNLDPCAIDGILTNWSQWSLCSQTCGFGQQSRNRTCIGPYHGGLQCPGSLYETRQCIVLECPVDGVPSEWSAWTYCSASCGQGQVHRLRSCVGPFYGGKPCKQKMKDSLNCTIKPCPVNGEFSQWSSWGSCNETCGGGFRFRNRSCDGPYFGGIACQGLFVDEKQCNTHNCPVDGIFHEWSQWSSCTVSCGGGISKRYRHCIGPFHGGIDCLGSREQSDQCNSQECPVDGFWEMWSDWGQCNKTCETGYKQRFRVCIAPRFGGKDCIGESTQISTCNTHLCPVDGRFEEWSIWTPCDKSCGTGRTRRNRTCTGPFHGGTECVGPRHETVQCNINPCPLEGTWSAWATWETCSVTCGGGIRNRQRSCQLNSTLYQTLPCSGDTRQTEKCHRYSCTPLQTSCKSWKSLGMVDNCLAEILIGGLAMLVTCDMQMEGGIGVTIINHDFKDKEVAVSGYEGAGEYQQKIRYQHIELYDLMDLKAESSRCKQKLTWRCYSATITISAGSETRHITYWENIDGQKRYNWGGASFSGKCACGMTDSCFRPGLACNCDANDQVWRSDTGWITDKNDLPVTKIRAGDTGAKRKGSQEGFEQGYWSLGPLICY
ncbi:SCO-spondin-like [Tubulanus polymorphus]|uniref:SCO-spondin-like n=1 Tax=Tubulanus polymorphus TaxID=672921 RepID=UPI003DA2A21C